MEKGFDQSAVASDIARSRIQYLARLFSRLVVRALGLNRPGFVTTEMVQAIHPIASIPTAYGPLLSRCGHGRLLWRARTFHTEEPETIAWLDSLHQTDVLWDVGANVGLYSIYAAKFKGCKVIAVEPESQNFALLVENIVLNEVEDRCFPACFAISNRLELGRLCVRYITKGGAYHLFESIETQDRGLATTVPASIRAVEGARENGKAVKQYLFGVSLDDLFSKKHFPPPTHLKVDVDGLEPEIVEGAKCLLGSRDLRSILIEVNKKSVRDMEIPQLLAQNGFRLVSERSNWLSRVDRSKENDIPATNMIFLRS